MTIIVESVRAIGSRELPSPGPGRFRPLRAGIRNVWEYDNQEFWFSGGRLILRGANTAGKSKALELLLPFVLDGETRPERLDPFGNRSKTMYWNLIEFDDDRRSATGYCWIEFGRVDDDGQSHFVTAVVGMRANRGAGRKGVETWFAVTPMRVGGELDLAPDGVPLPPEGLRDALGGRGRFCIAARDHRSAVDQALFQLGAERYDSLIHLLLVLRRPKLSEKLDVAKLADILTEALPPLEHNRLELLSRGFSRLDAEAAELETLEGARTELEGFLSAYRSYGRVHARLRAVAVRSANNRFDGVTRTERAERESLESAQAELATVEHQRAELDSDLTRLRGQLEGLDLSKVQHLQLVEVRAVEAERVASEGAARAGADEELSAAAALLGATAIAEASAAESRREAAVSAAGKLAAQTGMTVAFDAQLEQLLADPSAARRSLAGATDRRRVELDAVRVAAAADGAARREVEVAARRAEEADQAVAGGEELAAAAEEAVVAAGVELSESVDAWTASLPTEVSARVGLRAGLGEQALGAALGAGLDARASEAAARGLAEDLCAPARESITRERAGVMAEIGRLSRQRESLSADRDRIAAEHDDAPPAAAGRPEQRPEGCAPLWSCIDFAPTLAGAERANLEAALHAAGLLDALVTPEGHLVDPATLDSVITRRADAGTGAASLGQWLLADPAAPLAAEAVAAALGVIGTGPSGLTAATDAAEPTYAARAAGAARPGGHTSGATTWVDLDGRWVNGALAGRWTKPQADYIGASARAAARVRRIETIDAEIAAIESTVSELTHEAEALDALAAALADAIRSFPSPAALRDALHDEVRAGTELARTREMARRELGALDSARILAERAHQQLAAIEHTSRCVAAAVDETIAALGRWMTGLADAAATVVAAQRERLSAEQAVATAGSLQARADQSRATAARDRQHADGRRGEADELRQTEGADVDAILARKATLQGAQGEAIERQSALSDRRDVVRDLLKVAETQLAATEAERVERERERVDALLAMSRLAATELGALALGPIDPDRELTQVTAGLAFARAAADRLDDVATDQRAQDAATNRLHESFNHLRARLGADFDPHLDTSEGVQLCFAKLNGISVGASDLASALDDQIRRRRETLSADERELIERHLLAEVGGHLGERVHAAHSHIRHMNDQLTEHPTTSGVTLQLRWEPDPDAGTGAIEALRLLKRDVHLLDVAERAALAAFLAERVRAARDNAEGADSAEAMASALDYRSWHRFTVVRRAGGREERFTSRTQARGSGGEQAKLAHLPLFAATAGYYSSAAATAPRLIVLDEAFAGIDDSQRADCMGMLVELELDAVLTNYAEWGCYPEVPSVAIYHLERTDGQRGVAALRFVWDGARRREHDPFLHSLEPPEPSDGLFGRE